MAVRQGKRVIVHLRDGTKVVAKFKERRDRELLFYDHDPIPTEHVRTISIYRQSAEEQ